MKITVTWDSGKWLVRMETRRGVEIEIVASTLGQACEAAVELADVANT